MTDLETACRELLAEWREWPTEDLDWNDYRDGQKDAAMKCALDLESVLEKHTDLDPDVKHLVEQMEDAT